MPAIACDFLQWCGVSITDSLGPPAAKSTPGRSVAVPSLAKKPCRRRCDGAHWNRVFSWLDRIWPALSLLRRVEDLEFFGFIRRTTVLNLYGDPDVLKALGYEGESFSQGGYLHRGFDDLDWLPKARIEETEEALTEVGPLPYKVRSTADTPSAEGSPPTEGSGGSSAAAAAGPHPQSGIGAEGKTQQPGADQ